MKAKWTIGLIALFCAAASPGLDGDYNGSITGTDGNSTTGHVHLTVSGSSVRGTVSGHWMGKAEDGQENSDQDQDSYSGSFSGTVDPASGSISAQLAGKIGDMDFAGHISGNIQGNEVHGTWNAATEFLKSNGTWSASQPVPAVPIPGSTGDSSDIIASPPPGITNVGDVPGPADLPETGTGVVLPGLIAATTIGIKALLDSSATPPPVVDYGASTPGPDPTDGSAVPPTPTPVASDYGPDHTQAVQDAQDATDRYNQMQQQFTAFQNGADTSSPNYASQQQQYQNYLNYYKQKADEATAKADAIAQTVETDRNTRVLKDTLGNDKAVVYDPATGLWHDRETGNIFDPDQWERVQNQAASDAAWNQAQMDRLGARQDSFSQQMDQMVRDQKQHQLAEEYVIREGHEAMNQGLWNPGGPGDVYGQTQTMLQDLYDGKPVDIAAIKQVRTVVGDRIMGKTTEESTLANADPGVIDSAQTAAWNTLRESITQKGVDGSSTNLIGWVSTTVLRGSLAVATGLRSEIGYSYLNGLYAANDAYQGNATWGQAALSGTLTTIMEAAPTVVGLGAAYAVPKYFPNVADGLGEMSNMFKARVNMVVNRGNLSAAEHQAMWDTREAVERTLRSENPADIARLYTDDGMRDLGRLQAHGGLSLDEARALNSRLAPVVQEHLDGAVKQTISEFEAENGVKLQETILGDSGSSASSKGNPKALTDFDVTSVLNPERDGPKGLEVYASDHGISVAEAQQRLNQWFGNRLTQNMNGRLVGNGFSGGVNDIHYTTYSAIGPDAAVADSYGAGTTGARQGVGRGTLVTTDASGELVSHRIGGQAVVDQNGLNSLTNTGRLPANPDKLSPDEFHLYSEQQVQAVNLHGDVKSVAKALGREQELANRMQSISGSSYDVHAAEWNRAGLPATAPPPLNSDLTRVATAINKNPDEAMRILHANGFRDEAAFRDVGQAEINRFNEALHRR